MLLFAFINKSKCCIRIFSAFIFSFVCLSCIKGYSQQAGSKQGDFERVSATSIEKGYLPIKNYSSLEYGAMPQNWAIVQDKRGVMYIGNNEGILEYDGVMFRKIILPDDPNIRSLSIDSNGVIYVGAQGDFGYLSPDSIGKLIFVSLLPYLENKNRDFGDVWTNYVTPQGVYFQSSNHIFRWDGDTVKVWLANISEDSKFHLMFYVNNTLYVRQKTVGLMQMLNDQLVLIQGGELFAGQDIYFMIPYDQGQILLNTRNHGLYIMKPTDMDYFPKDRKNPEQINVITPFRTQIDNFFIDNFIYNGIRLPNSNFAIGTQGGGVTVIDKNGKLVQILNKNTGLQDGTISYQYLDNKNNMWLALGNGISRVEISSPITSFNDKTGLEGTIQSITRHNGTLYAATLLGLFYLPSADDKNAIEAIDASKLSDYEHSNFKQVEGISTQCWNLLSIENSTDPHLLVTANEGIFEIDKNQKATLISKYDSWMLYHSKVDPSRVFIGCTDGIASLYLKNGKWLDAGKVDGVDASIISIAEDPEQNLWLSRLPEGIIKLKVLSALPNGKINDTEIITYDSSNGLPAGLISLQNAMGGILFASEIGLFKYNGHGFIRDTTFGSDFANGIKRIHRASEDKNGNVWMETISSKDGKFEIGFAQKTGNHNFKWISTPFMGISDEIVHAIFHDNNGVTWLGGPQGIYRYDSNVKKDYEKEFPAMIRMVLSGEDSVIFWGAFFDDKKLLVLSQPPYMKPVLKYEFNSLTFIYAAPSFDNESGILFSHYLEGFDKNWTVWHNEAKAVYTNLPEGDYKFRVKAINTYFHESTEALYEFTILPPWHRTIWAYMAYILGFIGFVYVAITVSTRGLQKIIKQKTAEVVRQKEEIELKSKDITDSINYAQKLQEAILPTDKDARKLFPESFILFKPKDIVSGDFYWLNEKDGKALIAAADCTGHGVPGAFMSMIGTSLLNEVVNEKGIVTPSLVLQFIKEGVIKSLKQTGEAGKQKDGMDIAFCAFDFKKRELEYAGAYNPLYMVRDNEIIETRADRMPIGIYQDDGGRTFTNQVIKIQKGDVFYIFSDGYVDQFGGPKGKKFMSKRFKQFFLDIHSLPMDRQKAKMDENIEEWKAYTNEHGATYEQMDDILVIGIKV